MSEILRRRWALVRDEWMERAPISMLIDIDNIFDEVSDELAQRISELSEAIRRICRARAMTLVPMGDLDTYVDHAIDEARALLTACQMRAAFEKCPRCGGSRVERSTWHPGHHVCRDCDIDLEGCGHNPEAAPLSESQMRAIVCPQCGKSDKVIPVKTEDVAYPVFFCERCMSYCFDTPEDQSVGQVRAEGEEDVRNISDDSRGS